MKKLFFVFTFLFSVGLVFSGQNQDRQSVQSPKSEQAKKQMVLSNKQLAGLFALCAAGAAAGVIATVYALHKFKYFPTAESVWDGLKQCWEQDKDEMAGQLVDAVFSNIEKKFEVGQGSSIDWETLIVTTSPFEG